MDWKTIRSELRKVSALVDEWSQRDGIPVVERDLALEKLRGLYEALRFTDTEELPAAGPAADGTDEAEEGPSEPIDLGEVLSLDGFPDLEESAGAIFVEPAFVSHPVAGPEMTLEEAPEESVTGSGEGKAAEFASVAGSELSAGPEMTLEEVAPKESVPEPPRHGSPTLFGLEDDEVLRHRHKQRVIMSLYDPSPTVERIPEPSHRHGAKHASEAAFGPMSTPRAEAESRPAEPSLESRPETSGSSQPDIPIDISTEKPTEKPEPGVMPEGADTVREADPHPESGEKDPEISRESGSVENSAADSVEPAEQSDAESAEQSDTGSADRSDAESGDLSDVESAFEELTVETISPTETSETSDEAGPDYAGASQMTPPVRESLAESQGLQGGTVLGEVINQDVQTLADTIAPPRDVASELRRNEPVTDLRKAIGLNDKFLMIRDLFGGDAAAYERAVETLNGFGDLDDCMIFIAEHYAWNPNSDGAKLMMELLERKFA